MCLAPVIRRRALQFGGFQSVARSGQKSIARGLPWVNSPGGMSPEGAGRYSENRLRAFEPDRVHISSPFGACPPGRMIGANHLRAAEREEGGA
jgi:hypothetical protein